jgi:hypothetical protein
LLLVRPANASGMVSDYLNCAANIRAILALGMIYLGL